MHISQAALRVGLAVRGVGFLGPVLELYNAPEQLHNESPEGHNYRISIQNSILDVIVAGA